MYLCAAEWATAGALLYGFCARAAQDGVAAGDQDSRRSARKQTAHSLASRSARKSAVIASITLHPLLAPAVAAILVADTVCGGSGRQRRARRAFQLQPDIEHLLVAPQGVHGTPGPPARRGSQELFGKRCKRRAARSR